MNVRFTDLFDLEERNFPYKTAYIACNGDCKGTCIYGCIGCSSCMEICKPGAIRLREGHAAVVDRIKCIGCGLCIQVCPQRVIHMHEDANRIIVACSNTDCGVKSKTVCGVSCIGCGLCEKTCTASAIHMISYLPHIDNDYCLSCGMCVVKCPRHALHDLRGILTD